MSLLLTMNGAYARLPPPASYEGRSGVPPSHRCARRGTEATIDVHMQDAHEPEPTGVNMPTHLPTNEHADLILRAREADSIRTDHHAERIAQSAGGAPLLHAVRARLNALAAFGS